MPERVYVETTIVSYLVARPSRDVVVAGHQQTTHEWWNTQRQQFSLYISQLVIQEAAAGDPEIAQERLNILKELAQVEMTTSALDLAKELVRDGALPQKAVDDALHIAVAATQQLTYLLTWNCRHLANATMRPLIESVCSRNGFQAPIICTPEELLGRNP